MMRKNPKYRKMIKNASKKAVNNLEKIFEKKWKEADENCGKPQITRGLQQGSPQFLVDQVNFK